MSIHAKLERVPNIPGAYHLVEDDGNLIALYSKGGYLLVLDPTLQDEIIEWLQSHNKPVGQVEVAEQ